MNYVRMFGILVMLVIISILASCRQQPQPQIVTPEKTLPVRGISVLHPTVGNDVSGTVVFTRNDDGTVTVVADINGLTPGRHGFHIHQLGDCSAADGTSAGGHFNPADNKHGGPSDQERHVGDLGNVEADAEGQAYYERKDPFLALDGPYSIIGRAVIVHSGADDLTTQPTGGAGARQACGVVGIAE